MRTRKLKWGTTPWDSLSKKQLLLDVQRMYSAIVSARSALAISSLNEKESPYWGKQGTGGCALEKCRQVLDPIHKKHSSETIWRAYFRTWDDLLFDLSTGFRIGYHWSVCPKCGTMLGGWEHIGKVPHILAQGCDGVMERLTWKHLRKTK